MNVITMYVCWSRGYTDPHGPRGQAPRKTTVTGSNINTGAAETCLYKNFYIQQDRKHVHSSLLSYLIKYLTMNTIRLSEDKGATFLRNVGKLHPLLSLPIYTTLKTFIDTACSVLLSNLHFTQQQSTPQPSACRAVLQRFKCPPSYSISSPEKRNDKGK